MIKDKRKVVTVRALLAKSNVSEVLDQIDKCEVRDLAVVYRDSKGVIRSRWVGDNLALTTMAVIMAHDIEDSITCPESEEDNGS